MVYLATTAFKSLVINRARLGGRSFRRPDDNSRYLLVFREHWNAEPVGTVAVHGCKDHRVLLADLLLGDQIEEAVDLDNQLQSTIEKAPGYQFFRYESIP